MTDQLREGFAGHGSHRPGTVCLECERLSPGPDVPPLPWTSPALLQPWPDAAGDVSEVRDAHGAPVFVRNWKEVCAALAHLVRLVNREHFAGALAHDRPSDSEYLWDKGYAAGRASVRAAKSPRSKSRSSAAADRPCREDEAYAAGRLAGFEEGLLAHDRPSGSGLSNTHWEIIEAALYDRGDFGVLGAVRRERATLSGSSDPEAVGLPESRHALYGSEPGASEAWADMAEAKPESPA